jgi:shikimate kinase / 3-dehydroquinate synthase
VRRVVLTGFMGTGKTTVGRLLSDRYGLEFADTDEEIEKQVGSPIAEFWKLHGEASFREVEKEIFARAMADGKEIVVTGGGTLISEANRRNIGEHDRVFCLSCGSAALAERLGDDVHRPLLGESQRKSAAALKELLGDRREVYSLFEEVDTTHISAEAAADEIAARAGLSNVGSLTLEGKRGSEILFGRCLLARAGELVSARMKAERALLVTDDNVEQRGWADVLERSLEAAGCESTRIVIAAGERGKNLETVEKIYRVAMHEELDRDAVVVGLGGGVVGDLAGFAAATYLRGLRLVLVPTTLIAQADAAIGGKVGVDLDDAKNLVGAFYPADVVITDPDTLSTLPSEALSHGLAEIVKIAVMRSPALLEAVQGLLDRRQILEASSVIRQAMQEKVQLVEADPYERGARAFLNFGHTIGHGLEAAGLNSGSERQLPHGEAIGVGMMAELRVAECHGYSDPAVTATVTTLLDRFRLPIVASGLDPEEIYEFICLDKKRSDGQIRFAVPTRIGKGRVISVTAEDVRKAIDIAVGAEG